jgi:hypothetical protein
VVGVTDPYGRILGFLDLEPLPFHSSSFSAVITRLGGPRSRPTIVRKSGSFGNRTRTSGSVASNSDY